MKNFFGGCFWCILAVISLELFAGHPAYASTTLADKILADNIRNPSHDYWGTDIDAITQKFKKIPNVTITESIYYTQNPYGNVIPEVGNALDEWNNGVKRTVVIPFNVGGHWIALVLDGDIVYIMDSNDSTGTRHQKKVRKFFKPPERTFKQFKIIALNVPQQKDGSSCGPRTIENFMAFLRRVPPRKNAQKIRNSHASIIESPEVVEWVEGGDEGEDELEVEVEEPNIPLGSSPSRSQGNARKRNELGKKSGESQELQTLLPQSQQGENAVNTISIILDYAIGPRVTEAISANTNTNYNTTPVVASGGTINDPYTTPKSYDIWARGCIGTIKQEATNNSETTAVSNLYGITVGIDKLFNNNSTLLGVALSYTPINTKYKIPQSSTTKEQKDNNYQANVYIHYSPTNYFFLEMIGGVGAYGNNAKIQNIFSLSQDYISGYHGCATVGYSFFPTERIALTPTLKLSYYHIYIPDSYFSNNKSSNFSTLGRLDSSIGIAIKLLEVNNNGKGNFAVIPEGTVAFKFRMHDSVNGVYADQLKLPKVASASYDDSSANALASPRQLLQLGAKVTLSTRNVSICVLGNVDIAKKYLAGICGINLQLSF